MKTRILAFISAFVIWSCDEPYTIETDQQDPQIIVEALLTNEFKQHFVKISETTDFYASGQTPTVSDATVLITDDRGNSFIYAEDQEDPGRYLSEIPFQGEVGVTYSLVIVINGQTISSSETMLRVTTIDSLTYSIDEEEKKYLEDHGIGRGRYYEVLLYTKEPQDTEDYYLFKFYRNGEILNYDGEDIYYADDEVIQENIDGIVFNDWYSKDEVAGIEMYSLSRNAFLFYADLEITLNNDGGLFSPLPTNPRTNLVGNALGLFQVSAIASEEITIK